MTAITVPSRVTGGGFAVTSGDQVQVLGGGALRASTVSSGDTIVLSAGALGRGLAIRAGGLLPGAGEFQG